MNVVMHLRVPCNVGSFLTIWGPLRFSRWSVHHGVSQLLVSYFVSSSVN